MFDVIAGSVLTASAVFCFCMLCLCAYQAPSLLSGVWAWSIVVISGFSVSFICLVTADSWRRLLK
jgi:hypothetical protein